MSKTFEATGTCLCGAVQLHAESASIHTGACHCAMCRNWGGGPYLSTACGPEVDITGEDAITRYSSSKWAERAFCSRCGTHLFYRLKANNQHFVACGLFGDEPRFVFHHQVFIDEKPDYYCFSNETKDMTGPEIFARFNDSMLS